MRLLDLLLGRRYIDFADHRVLFLETGNVFCWDGRKVWELGGTGLGLCLCIHNDHLIEGGTGGVFNYSTGEMYHRDGFVQAVCSHNATLYDSVIEHGVQDDEESVIRETIADKIVAKRPHSVMSLCSHAGVLYDGGHGFQVHETITGGLITDECDANVLCSHDGHLYAGGSSGIVFDVFQRRTVVRRGYRIWGLCSVSGTIYDSSEYGGVYETLSGRKVLDYAWIKHPRGKEVTGIGSMIVTQKELMRRIEGIMESAPRFHY